MPSTISRTYGRKPAPKRKTSPLSEEASSLMVASKRPRMTPPHIHQREPSTDVGDTLPDFKNNPTSSARLSSSSPPVQISPEKSTKPLQYRPTPTPTGTPVKLTKRMLGRSKTESSIDSQSSTSGSLAARTQSLPTLPPSPSRGHLGLNQQLERRESQPSAVQSSISAPKVKRTYAGQSRSFLISLPVTELPPDALRGIEREDDEFFEPESYSSLRLRWGVDDSEDDPVFLPTSPSKLRSKSSSNTSSPSRKGKGKVAAVPLPPGMMNPLKSITELRSKGESRRFLDEVGYLFEGMEPSNGIGLKRSSALEITIKLCNEEFAQKAKAADFYQKACDVFLRAGAGKGEDRILDILLALLASLTTRDPDSLAELASRVYRIEPEGAGSLSARKGKERMLSPRPENLVDILCFILKTSTNVDPLAMVSPSRSATDLEFKQIGLSKKDRGMLSSIYSTVSKSSLFPEDTSITTGLLVTHALRSLRPSLISPVQLPHLLHSLRSAITVSFSSNYPFEGNYPSEPDREPQYECIHNHLHLLDMYLLGQWDNSASDEETGINGQAIKSARDDWLVDGTIAIAVCAGIKSRKDNTGAACEYIEVLLRVLVNLTHEDADWANKLLDNEYTVNFLVRLLATSGLGPWHERGEVKAEGEGSDIERTANGSGSSHALDRLGLGLSLLTNLVQMVPGFKDSLRRTRLSLSCSMEDKVCARACRCPNAISILQILVRIYQRQSPNRITNPNDNGGTNIYIKSEPSPPPTRDSPALAAAEADASLIQGTLAVLFGLLMQGSVPNRTEILAAMSPPTGSGSHSSSDKAKVRQLAEKAKEFVTFYHAMSSENIEGETRFANEIVEFLERLKHEC